MHTYIDETGPRNTEQNTTYKGNVNEHIMMRHT